jgi:CheY-like chemotaxis protein
MSKRVLDVGNCGLDHGSIRGMLQRQFGAEVIQADTTAAALSALRDQPFDLVLVNRKFDADHDDGLALIRSIKQDQELGSTPVMLISNYEQYQQQAMSLGAEPGFGKSQLAAPETRENLGRLLGMQEEG